MPERSGTSGGGMGGFGAGLPVELFEATTDCVVVLDAEWRFAYLNSRAVAELQAEGVLGTVIWQSFPNAVGSKFEEIYRRVAERRESETFEAFYPPPLNAWYEVHAVPFQCSRVPAKPPAHTSVGELPHTANRLSVVPLVIGSQSVPS